MMGLMEACASDPALSAIYGTAVTSLLEDVAVGEVPRNLQRVPNQKPPGSSVSLLGRRS